MPHGMQSMENTFPHSLQIAMAITLAKKVQFSDKRCLDTNYKNGLLLSWKNFDSNQAGIFVQPRFTTRANKSTSLQRTVI